jgi:hypothetical protein
VCAEGRTAVSTYPHTKNFVGKFNNEFIQVSIDNCDYTAQVELWYILVAAGTGAS